MLPILSWYRGVPMQHTCWSATKHMDWAANGPFIREGMPLKSAGNAAAGAIFIVFAIGITAIHLTNDGQM